MADTIIGGLTGLSDFYKTKINKYNTTCPVLFPVDFTYSISFSKYNQDTLKGLAFNALEDEADMTRQFKAYKRSHKKWPKLSLQGLDLLIEKALDLRNEEVLRDVLAVWPEESIDFGRIIPFMTLSEHLDHPCERKDWFYYKQEFSNLIKLLCRSFIESAYTKRLKHLRIMKLADLPFLKERDTAEIVTLIDVLDKESKLLTSEELMEDFDSSNNSNNNMDESSDLVKNEKSQISQNCYIIEMNLHSQMTNKVIRLIEKQRREHQNVQIIIKCLRFANEFKYKVEHMSWEALPTVDGLDINYVNDEMSNNERKILLETLTEEKLKNIQFLGLNFVLRAYENFKRIGAHLSKLKMLTSLSIMNTDLSDDVRSLFRPLQRLESIRLVNVKLSSNDLMYLADSQHAHSLRFLDISGNDLSSNLDTSYVIRLLRRVADTLEIFEARNISWTETNFEDLVTELPHLVLTHLNVYDNEISKKIFDEVIAHDMLTLFIFSRFQYWHVNDFKKAAKAKKINLCTYVERYSIFGRF